MCKQLENAVVNLLLVDDDVDLLGMLKEFLETEGYNVTTAHDGITAEQYVLAGHFDLVILDVMMPVQDGLNTLAHIRKQSNIPVIMLTAKGDNEDKITGLELGADDYVQKPCTPRELIARVRAILRRAQSPLIASQVIAVDQLLVDPSQRQAKWQDYLLQLTSTEFNVLESLARHAGKVVSKDELSIQALGRPQAKFDRSIDVHVSSLRQKLSIASKRSDLIKTVYRQGYQLVKVA